MAVSTPAWLAACELPLAWRGRHSWRILDTDFADGQRLFPLWDAWAKDPQGPRTLHVVAIAPRAPDRRRLADNLAGSPGLQPDTEPMAQQWFGLLPGFHRLVMHDGRLRLTLCIGPLPSVLRALQFEADAIVFDPACGKACEHGASAPAPDDDTIKALTRLCRRGTRLAAWPDTGPTRTLLARAGFVAAGAMPAADAAQSGASPCGVGAYQYQPRWRIATTRSAWRREAAPVAHCVVIGAGLAGAAVADALACRGWRVTVLDSALAPASGASGLPVGLVAPQVSRDDNLRSRLSRAGIRMTLDSARRLLRHGQDWAWSGVAELGARANASLPEHWPLEGRQWSRPGVGPDPASPGPDLLTHHASGLWHAGAAWIKPARLVQACLSRPAVQFVGASTVHTMTRADGAWLLRGAGGALLGQAPHVVIACAGDAVRLINQAMPAATAGARWLPLSAVDGQVSWAPHTPGDATLLPPFPVNGAGSMVAHVPYQDTSAWFCGATYSPATPAPAGTAADHQRNLERIGQLLPAAAQALAPAFADGRVHAWRGTRWTTPDRLPLAGAVDAQALPGLWVSAAMGSRGLTHAVLCAEVIAAQIGAEPPPLEARMLRSIAPSRRALLHHL